MNMQEALEKLNAWKYSLRDSRVESYLDEHGHLLDYKTILEQLITKKTVSKFVDDPQLGEGNSLKISSSDSMGKFFTTTGWFGYVNNNPDDCFYSNRVYINEFLGDENVSKWQTDAFNQNVTVYDDYITYNWGPIGVTYDITDLVLGRFPRDRFINWTEDPLEEVKE